jgi:hypothetical protein
MKELETIIHNEDGIRVGIDEWHEGVWLSFQGSHASMHTTFTREEAEQLFVALIKILDKEVA